MKTNKLFQLDTHNGQLCEVGITHAFSASSYGGIYIKGPGHSREISHLYWKRDTKPSFYSKYDTWIGIPIHL